MMDIDIEDKIIAVGKCINSLDFKAYPTDETVLEYLIAQNDNILFYFPTEIKKHRRNARMDVHLYSDLINSHIGSAHIETDCFIDSEELYVFSQLRHLTLSISNTDVKYYNDDDIYKFSHALANLAGNCLITITIDISELEQTAADQIKEMFAKPHGLETLSFLEKNPKKGARHKLVKKTS